MGFLRTAETRWAPRIARQHRLPTSTPPSALTECCGRPVALWAAHVHADPQTFSATPDPCRIVHVDAAVAFVNRGRWVARCPFCVKAAIEVSPDDRRFYCPVCLNEPAGGEYVPVVFPDELTLAAIEDLLGRRPNPVNRNWQGETVAQLRAENDAHRDELLSSPVLV